MLMPSIFGENLFDDFMSDFPFFDDRDLRKTERKLYGHNAKRLMKTDIKETDSGFELEMDLPGFKKDEILKNFFGGTGTFHRRTSGGFRNGGFRETHFDRDFSEKGSDIQSKIEVSFDDAAFGGKKRIQMQDAYGQVQSLEVNIPAGIPDGKIIRLKGKGMPGRNGGEAGDLLLQVMVHDKPGFRRDGQNVYTTVTVPFTTAALGGEAKIATIYGDVVCKIKEGTQFGSKIRLKGKVIRNTVLPMKTAHGIFCVFPILHSTTRSSLSLI